METSRLLYLICSLFVVVFLRTSHISVEAQQTYLANKQLDCYNDVNYTDGYSCNSVQSSCQAYLTFRSNPPYNSPADIGLLLGSEPSLIAEANEISNFDTISTDTQILIPANCSCSGPYYQYNTSYQLSRRDETYFSVANNTYQGLTTCQAMMAQNSYDSRNLTVGLNLKVPLRCACPTFNQTAAGIEYLLTYMVASGDSVSAISELFGVDLQSVLHANDLSEESIIFPFTPLLIPLKRKPSRIRRTAPPPPSPPPPSPTPAAPGSGKSNKRWVFVGVGIGAAALLVLSAFLLWFFCGGQSHKKAPQPLPTLAPPIKKPPQSSYENSWTISTEGVRYAIESLTVYKFDELEKATGFFREANRIKGSVYRGSFKGDDAAVKVMKGDVSSEINLLTRINHSNIIRLSGFCVHGGNTYLVYEHAENGSLSDWLQSNKLQNHSPLTWKQRVQVAYDVADALNYLHNYANPPYIHKNLKTSNILLVSNFRAKVSNFGLARTMENQDDGGLQLTRHVVGTQGYMAPEYIENGVITPKLDVFAFGVVVLELLSGREATAADKDGGDREELLFASIRLVLEGDNVRDKLREFVDPSLGHEYPLDLAFSIAQLAKSCVAHDLNSRPAMSEVFATLSKILSSSLDWDPSDELERSTSIGQIHVR
ncbi:protein LYK5 [Juglans microcarpa x Juglans regia]|uniref:protein LYK5 n=1 Tax=Juglans microcarpa x Juglans regia TaxID=2249226 RepID=UPI001B7ECA9B|nr:protein LYK5 [Juglans microcarpa x Juglans regia]